MKYAFSNAFAKAALVLLPLVHLSGMNEAQANPKNIGSNIEMFVDDYLLANTNNVALKLHRPVKKEIVLQADGQLITPTSGYFTVLQDGDQTRIYFRGNRTDNGGEITLMATSNDGINFTSPNLGIYEINGSTNNNAVWAAVQAHNLAPFIDTNPNAAPDARYKAFGSGILGQIYALKSPDGIHWQMMQTDPLTIPGSFDSLNTATWDEQAQVYRSFTRYLDNNDIRAIQMSTSTDFINWTPPQPFQYDVPIEQFYTNAIVRAPGAEQIWMGFPMRLDLGRTNDPEGGSGVSDAVFITSRDGVNWDRTFTEPWIEEGFDTARSNMPAWGLIETSPTEWSVYSTERYRTSENRLRRLSVRPWGFASVSADGTAGSFETPPITFTGDDLILNFQTAGTGSISVEIRDELGNPIPGFTSGDMVPLTGDEIKHRVEWTSGQSLGSLAGQTVRLYFALDDADLFALQFAPAVPEPTTMVMGLAGALAVLTSRTFRER